MRELWTHFGLGHFSDSKRQGESTDNPQHSSELTSDDCAVAVTSNNLNPNHVEGLILFRHKWEQLHWSEPDLLRRQPGCTLQFWVLLVPAKGAARLRHCRQTRGLRFPETTWSHAERSTTVITGMIPIPAHSSTAATSLCEDCTVPLSPKTALTPLSSSFSITLPAQQERCNTSQDAPRCCCRRVAPAACDTCASPASQEPFPSLLLPTSVPAQDRRQVLHLSLLRVCSLLGRRGGLWEYQRLHKHRRDRGPALSSHRQAV